MEFFREIEEILEEKEEDSIEEFYKKWLNIREQAINIPEKEFPSHKIISDFINKNTVFITSVINDYRKSKQILPSYNC